MPRIVNRSRRARHRGMGATAQEYVLSTVKPVYRSSMGSLGDDDPTDPIAAAANAPTITVTADPQVAYDTCLRGGGSFASCNQIPGVTPEMIAVAKAKSIVSSPGAALAAAVADPGKLALIGGGALAIWYLFLRRKKR